MKQGHFVNMVVAVCILLALSGLAAADSNTIYYACKLKDGTIRMVSDTGLCKKGETEMWWNQTGPQGPAGPKGDQGIQGEPGANGAPGLNGQDGAPGLACWDLNQNGAADLDPEDVNGDGEVDVLDCAGPQGLQGEKGDTGPAGPALLQALRGTPCDIPDDYGSAHEQKHLLLSTDPATGAITMRCGEPKVIFVSPGMVSGGYIEFAGGGAADCAGAEGCSIEVPYGTSITKALMSGYNNVDIYPGTIAICQDGSNPTIESWSGWQFACPAFTIVRDATITVQRP